MIERMEIAFPEDACICSLSMGWVGLLLGGGYFKAYEGGIICFFSHTIFRTRQRASDVFPTWFWGVYFEEKPQCSRVEEIQLSNCVDKETEVLEVLASGGKNLGFGDRTAMCLWAGHCPQTHWCYDYWISSLPTMREKLKKLDCFWNKTMKSLGASTGIYCWDRWKRLGQTRLGALFRFHTWLWPWVTTPYLRRVSTVKVGFETCLERQGSLGLEKRWIKGKDQRALVKLLKVHPTHDPQVTCGWGKLWMWTKSRLK